MKAYREKDKTGWSPDDFQFYTDEWTNNVSGDLNINKTYSFNTTEELLPWIDWDFGPTGNYYFESTTFDAGHTVSATTRLTFNYSPNSVPEPSACGLLLIGLFSFSALLIKKSKPSKKRSI